MADQPILGRARLGQFRLGTGIDEELIITLPDPYTQYTITLDEAVQYTITLDETTED